MIDVNKITSTLAKLSDLQLQTYAKMNPDPYTIALAVAESNRRKELRAASQAPAQQEQPKVVDQMVAEMAPQQLPEEQGIGRLNAGNMNFADGGIVAFAGGGDVERYAGQYGSLTGDIPGFVAGTGNFIPQQGAPEEEPLLRRWYREMSEKNAAARSAEEKRRVAQGFAAPSAQMQAETSAAQANPMQDMAQFDAASNLYMTERANKQAAAAAPTASAAAPKVDAGKTPPRAPGAGAATPSAGLPGLSDLTALRQRISDKQDFKDPAAAGLLELEARERANAAADKTAIERDAERFKDAYKGRESRLAEREADIGKQKDSNMGLAFLNAGLAIMSTPGGLATAIGKGAQVGTAQFAAGLDKIRSAQERLGEARDRLDDLKLNREESTAKEIRAAERNYRDVSVNAQKRTIDGIRMAADVNEKRASDIYSKTVDMTKTVYEQQQANARNAATVAASGRNNQLELLEAVSKDPKLAAAYQAMHGKGEDIMGQFNDFVKANPTLQADPKQAFSQFLMTKSAFQQLGRPTVTEKPTGTLRTQ